jgi:hypothetical protein
MLPFGARSYELSSFQAFGLLGPPHQVFISFGVDDDEALPPLDEEKWPPLCSTVQEGAGIFSESRVFDNVIDVYLSHCLPP